MKSKNQKYGYFVPIFLFIFFTTLTESFSTPIYNRYDPNSFHSVFGTDKFYTKKEGWLNLRLSPFYQSAAGAKNADSIKVPEGDILGNWSMIPLFFNASNACPTNKQFEFNEYGVPQGSTEAEGYYKYFSRARRVLDGLDETASPNIAPPTVAWPNTGTVLEQIPNTKEGTDIITNYTDEVKFLKTFKPEILEQLGAFSIPIEYEKVGLRGQLELNFGAGFGLKCKSGVVQYKQRPTFNDLTMTATTSDENARQYIKTYLTSEDSRTQILNELDLNIKEQREVAMEDTHIELYWNYAFELNDFEGEHVVSLAPYLSLGFWLPSGEKQDPRKAFSMPTGNDGFWAATIEGSINIDFPGMVQLAFGGGANFYESKHYNQYRVPASKHQSGIFPWYAKIRKSPGTLWYVNASFMAKNIIDTLSAYFDYVHIEHEKDSINIREGDARNKYFHPEILEEESKWKGDYIHGGLNYAITPGLEIGLSFNALLTGVKVYRTTTILGTLSFNF